VTASIQLPGVSADSPAATLALYGIARLLAPDISVCWTRHAELKWHADVLSARCADLDELVGMLIEAIESDPLTGLQSIAKDVNELTPHTWSCALSAEGAVAGLLEGLCAEAPLRTGGRVSLTPVCVYSFGTRGTLFGNVAKQDGALRPAELRALLHGPWMPKKGCNTLGFDPYARRQDGAIIGPDPSADGVRGVPALIPLASRGLAAVAPMPAAGRVRGGAFVSDGTRLDFRWPVFTSPVSAAALPLMAARDWSRRTDAQRAAAGIEAVFASRILRGERRLSIGRRVA
jgi:hypothetical protein